MGFTPERLYLEWHKLLWEQLGPSLSTMEFWIIRGEKDMKCWKGHEQ